MKNDLSRIRKARRTVELPGEDGETVAVQVRALSVGQISDLLDTHRDIALSFAAGEAVALVDSIFKAGPGAINDVIDAGAGLEPGTAEASELGAADTLLLVSAIIDLTLDADSVEKLATQAGPLLKRLGLAADVEETSETSGPKTSNG